MNGEAELLVSCRVCPLALMPLWSFLCSEASQQQSNTPSMQSSCNPLALVACRPPMQLSLQEIHAGWAPPRHTPCSPLPSAGSPVISACMPCFTPFLKESEEPKQNGNLQEEKGVRKKRTPAAAAPPERSTTAG
jgi:hypothetical protein